MKIGGQGAHFNEQDAKRFVSRQCFSLSVFEYLNISCHFVSWTPRLNFYRGEFYYL